MLLRTHEKHWILRMEDFFDSLWNVFKEEAGKALAILLGILGSTLLLGLKRLTKFVGVGRTVIDDLVIINKAYVIRKVFEALVEYSGALYIHVIRYHNGKKNKDLSKPVHYDRMSVEYEEIGKTCGQCGTDCFKFKTIPELKPDWQKIPIADDWRKGVYDKTVALKQSVHTISVDQLDQSGQEIFQRFHIKLFKEIYIGTTERGTYTLGLSFCTKFEDTNSAEGLMTLSSKQLSNYMF